MTRVSRSHGPPDAHRVQCPCCQRQLAVSYDWVGSDEYDAGEPVAVLEAVPLRDQPCRYETFTMLVRCDAYSGPGWRGVECNWLCNVPSHVTPCYMCGPLGSYPWTGDRPGTVLATTEDNTPSVDACGSPGRHQARLTAGAARTLVGTGGASCSD